MLGLLLVASPTLLFNLLDPGAVIFGLLLMLLSAAVPLLILFARVPQLTKPLFWILLVIELILVAVVVVDFSILPTISSNATSRDLSILFANHRWLLFEAPLLLVALACVILGIYRERLFEAHARPYRQAVVLSVIVSFICVLIVTAEAF